MEVTAIHELRWPGSSNIVLVNHIIFYSGLERGTAIVIQHTTVRSTKLHEKKTKYHTKYEIDHLLNDYTYDSNVMDVKSSRPLSRQNKD